MTDVFISYKKEDAGRVIRLVEALRAEGLAVWWDHGIRAGTEWDRSIHEALYAAKVVIAIWSTASVRAPWVKEEATVGKNRGVLLPIRIDDVEAPLGFMMIQSANLVGWRGDRADPRWPPLLDAVRAIARQDVPASLAPRSSERAEPPLRAAPALAAGLAIVVLLAGLLGWLVWPTRDSAPDASRPPAPPVAGAPSIPARPQIAAGEQQLWDKAMAEKARAGFQSYLLAYPNGAYAQRARDILLTCRSETRESWKPGPPVANQMLRGVGDTSAGMTPVQACAKAKSDVQSLARRLCETIVHNGGFRDPRWTVQDRDCDCERPSPQVMICIADQPYSCMWEMRASEVVETCG